MLSTKLKEAAGNGADATLYVDDVFSTYLYTGNNSTQTITNGIDLAGNGGLVWIKERNFTDSHQLIDTNRGVGNALSSDLSFANNYSPTGLTNFNSTGFSVGSSSYVNSSSYNYASWTFRKAAKFFDVVTYTGTGSARTIAHSLGVAPGMVIVKRTDATKDWQVYSNGLTSAAYSIQLNLTDLQASAPNVWNSTAPTSSVFSVGTDSTVNASGGTYVAYLYAHDTSSTGIIQCGSYTGNGSATGPVVTLGWEPQYLMIKEATAANTWTVFDQMRYLNNNGSGYLTPNSTAVENGTSGLIGVLATGFRMLQSGTLLNQSGQTYIYMAIRRPNKPPTTGTQVYNPIARSGTGSNTTFNTNIVSDVVLIEGRTGSFSGRNKFIPRLAGSANYLNSNETGAESTLGESFYGIGMQTYCGLGTDSETNSGSTTYINWVFKRAPGFFDVVCYTGTGVATTQAHNLTVVPELMIVKTRSNVGEWCVYSSNLGNTKSLFLSSTQGADIANAYWNSTTPTSSVFSIGTFNATNNYTYVAYLFATLAGISKVGSYTGNGSTGQVIACGFSAGARFVLIKRTDTAGAWYTFDSARGLTSGSSPYLLLNSTAAETTGNNGVYASTGGFTLDSTASTTTNINGASYIYLSVA